MKIVKYNHLTEAIIQKFSDVLAEGFQQNEFVYTYLMGRNPAMLKKFMNMMVRFNHHFADYYALIKEDGEWGAAIVYLPAGCDPIGLRALLKRKQLLAVVRLFVSTPPKYIKRMLQYSDLEEKKCCKKPFVTLDMVVSLEKGCGKTLIDATLHNYDGQTILLNSSVTQKDHVYYTQFGFKPYAELLLDKYKTIIMVKQP